MPACASCGRKLPSRDAPCPACDRHDFFGCLAGAWFPHWSLAGAGLGVVLSWRGDPLAARAPLQAPAAFAAVGIGLGALPLLLGRLFARQRRRGPPGRG
jgi:hypothetical protein